MSRSLPSVDRLSTDELLSEFSAVSEPFEISIELKSGAIKTILAQIPATGSDYEQYKRDAAEYIKRIKFGPWLPGEEIGAGFSEIALAKLYAVHRFSLEPKFSLQQVLSLHAAPYFVEMFVDQCNYRRTASRETALAEGIAEGKGSAESEQITCS